MSASHDRADTTDSTDSRDRGQRWSSLLGLLAAHGRLSVSQVCAELDVSEATVRRDFRELAAQQLVTRTHGGVVATSVAYELPARYKSALADDDKERIARAAALLVAAGSVVGFNGGTTTSATARRLAARADLASSSQRPAITVVSNALNIASEMVLRPFIRCVSLGGVARPESYEQSGPLATMVLEQLWLDTLVLGVDALSATDGASCDHDGEAGINSLMVRRADRVIVVTTGDKVGKRSFSRICESSAIDVLVTDASAPGPELEALAALGVQIVIA
jgi:DeoR family transcriptional regulator, aga operon transcriptional repressor